MSQFTLPRIYFSGRALVNAPTGNNLLKVVDPVHVRLNSNEASQDIVQRLTEDTSLNSSHWNYYGDFGFEFQDVRIVSVFEEQGRVADRDPLVGASLSLRYGLMIDSDPTSVFTSQIFADKLLITKHGAAIYGDVSPHAARWYNANRVSDGVGTGRASAVFQARIRNAQFKGLEAGALWEALREPPRDLFLQYTLANGSTRYSLPDLAGFLFYGIHRGNPFVCEVEGTLTLAEDSDRDSVSLERVLVPQLSRNKPPIGVAFARVVPDRKEGGSLLLDVLNTYPYEKGDGEIQEPFEVLVKPLEARVDLSRNAVIASGGIVSLALSEGELAQLRREPLELSAPRQMPLQEPIMFASAQPRSLYLDEGESGYLDVYAHGLRAEQARHVEVAMVPSRMSSEAGADQGIVELINDYEPRQVQGVDVWRVAMRERQARLQFRAVGPGAVHLVFCVGPCPENEMTLKAAVDALARPAVGVHPLGDGFANVRVRPDDERQVEEDRKDDSFAALYRAILKYYDVVFPYMSSRHFRFDDESAVRTNARQIIARLELPAEHPGHMPPSRDMSVAKRKWLIAYLKRLTQE